MACDSYNVESWLLAVIPIHGVHFRLKGTQALCGPLRSLPIMILERLMLWHIPWLSPN